MVWINFGKFPGPATPFQFWNFALFYFGNFEYDKPYGS